MTIWKTLTLIFVLIVISRFVVVSSAELPKFSVGVYACYEFSGNISTLSGQVVYNHTSVRNCSIIELNESTARVKIEFNILQVNGDVPFQVNNTFNVFPSTDFTVEWELNLSMSSWSLYFNETAPDLISYKVGEKVVESNIGLIDCHHLQRVGPKQEWDAFYDKNSGILVTFEETYLPEDYRVTYSYHITDTNANLNVVGSWEMPYYIGTLIVVVIVVSVGVTVFSLRKNVSSSKTQSDQLNNSQSKIHGRRTQKLHRSSLTC